MNFQLRLLKLIGRISRHTEAAQAALQVLTVKRHSELTVYLHGDRLSWVREGDASEWRDFLKWYFGRPQSSVFVMAHTGGCQMFQRSDIRRYEIRTILR